MTCTLDRDSYDIVTWQINGTIPLDAVIKVELEHAWYDMDVQGDQASILIAGPDYDPAVTGGPLLSDCVVVTGDQVARVSVNGITRTDGWLHLHVGD